MYRHTRTTNAYLTRTTKAYLMLVLITQVDIRSEENLELVRIRHFGRIVLVDVGNG